MPHIKICSKQYIHPPPGKGRRPAAAEPRLYDEPVVRELIKLGELLELQLWQTSGGREPVQLQDLRTAELIDRRSAHSLLES